MTMDNAMQKQPVITVTTITTLASAILAAIALVVDLPPDTEQVVLGLIAALYPVVTAAWTWHKVYAPASVERVKVEEFEAGQASIAAPVEPPRATPSRNVKPSDPVARYTRPGA